MKKIDWGMVFPLFAFVVFIAFGLAVVGREFVRREIYIYDLGAPISWVAVLLHYTIIYLSVVGGSSPTRSSERLAAVEPYASRDDVLLGDSSRVALSSKFLRN